MAEAILKEATTKDEQATHVHTTFERRLGSELVKSTKGKTKDKDAVKELVRSWDKNGDGDINKMEFRTVVRDKLRLKADNQEIDAFFASMDVDGGGQLDLNEIKPALKKLMDASAGAEAEARGLQTAAERLRTKAAVMKEVAQSTKAFEDADARLSELRGQQKVEAKLGAKIISKNLKIGDVVTKWDPSGDGSVDKAEFRTNVLELGVEASGAEIDALFNSLDEDGGGSLDVSELKHTLKKLTDAAAAAEQEFKGLSASQAALRKTALKQQKDLAAQQAREEMVAKEAEAAKLAADTAVAEAEAAQATKKKEERAAAATKAKEDKAAYDAKIEVRRKAAPGAKGPAAPA